MRTIFISGCLCLLVCSGRAEEQDTVNVRRQVVLDEVVIQSFKQNRDLRLEPLSASSVTGTSIQNKNITGIKEFSSFIPNLFMPDYGSKLTSPVYIRGIGSKINAPSVGLYVDGIPYFEKSAFDFDFAEIDRVEVLRGPQGTLYGRNTMGGLMNVYTKSPLKYQGTNVSISNGTYGVREYALSRYAKIGNTFGYSLAADYNRGDGYFTNLFTDQKVDDQKSGSGRIRLEWQPTKRLSFGLVSSYDYSKQGGYPYAICDSLTHLPGDVNYNDYSYYKRAISTTGLTIGYTGAGYSLSSKASFQYLSDHQGVDQDFSPKSIYFARQDQKQKMFSEELNIKSTTRNRYKWLFGVFGFWQGIDNTVVVDYLAQKYNSRKLYDTPTYGIAVYHQSTWDDLLFDGLSATFGIRYDYERASTDYLSFKDTENSTEQLDAFYSKLKFSQVTPKFALQYLFPSSGILYATVTKGYKTGGFNTSFEREEERSFHPETSWNYEVGGKHPFLDNRLRAEISFFWIDWKNQQISRALAVGSMLNNAGRSESKGVEVSLQGNPVNGLMLQLNYGFTHATFKEYLYVDERKNEEIDYSGNYLPMVPSHTFAAGADYTLSNPCSHIDRIMLSALFTGAGRIYWKESNVVSQPFYGQLNGKIAVTKGVATLAVWAKNMTNTQYTAFYFEMGKNGLAQSGRPFTIGGSIAVAF